MKSKSLCNIYIGLWCLYYMQGILYPMGSILSRAILVLLLLLSCYYYYLCNRCKMLMPMRILSFLMVIWIIYGVVYMLTGFRGAFYYIPPYYYLKNICISIMPIFAFYYFARRGLLTKVDLRYWFFVFLIVAIASFYLDQSLTAEKINKEEFTNNTGYFILSLFPLIPLFYKKPIIQYVLIFVCMIFILMSFKRGAVICGVGCTLFLVLFGNNSGKDGRNNRRRFLRIIAIGAFVVAAIYAVQYYLSTSDYLVSRIDRTAEGDSSGRDWIYETMYYYFINQNNVLTFLFGNGADSTLYLFEVYAHNDWLEIALNNGLLVVLIYVIYWASFIKLLVKGNIKSTSTQMLALFVFIYFFKTIFSMSYNEISFFSASAAGYALANYEYKNKYFIG